MGFQGEEELQWAFKGRRNCNGLSMGGGGRAWVVGSDSLESGTPLGESPGAWDSPQKGGAPRGRAGQRDLRSNLGDGA